MTFVPKPATIGAATHEAATATQAPNFLSMTPGELLQATLTAVNEIRASLELAPITAMPQGGLASSENSLSEALDERIRSYTNADGYSAFLVTGDLKAGLAVESCGYATRYPGSEFHMVPGGPIWLDLLLRPPLNLFLQGFYHGSYSELVLSPTEEDE